MLKHPAAARFAAAALVFALTIVQLPLPALANGGFEGQISALQEKIEQSGAQYEEATAKVDALNEQIAQNQERIAQVEAELPTQRERAAAAIGAAYRLQQNTPGLVELILSSESFNEFLATVTYLNAVQDHNAAETQKLVALEDELNRSKMELEAQRLEADAQAEAAKKALEEAQAARAEAQRQAEEQARREAEEAARAAAEKAAAEAAAAQQAAEQEAAANQNTATNNAAPQTPAAPSEPAPAPSTGGIDWSQDKTTFVNQWQPRIDAYLAGSPLAGTGKIFAEAAWDYGVDPRWSPAISHVESSKGLNCFRPYNAWGWGNASWGSWNEAIRSHVAGLARGYGSTLTYAAAKKYCPPNYDHWYNACAAQMNLI